MKPTKQTKKANALELRLSCTDPSIYWANSQVLPMALWLSGNKPFPEPISTNISDARWRHLAIIKYLDPFCFLPEAAFYIGAWMFYIHYGYGFHGWFNCIPYIPLPQMNQLFCLPVATFCHVNCMGCSIVCDVTQLNVRITDVSMRRHWLCKGAVKQSTRWTKWREHWDVVSAWKRPSDFNPCNALSPTAIFSSSGACSRTYNVQYGKQRKRTAFSWNIRTLFIRANVILVNCHSNVSIRWGLRHQKDISRAWINRSRSRSRFGIKTGLWVIPSWCNDYIPENSVGCNYLSIYIPASGFKVLKYLCVYQLQDTYPINTFFNEIFKVKIHGSTSGWFYIFKSLQRRQSGRGGVSNHQPRHCLLNRLFRSGSKKISKLRVIGLCVGNSPMTSGFPAQRTSNKENHSI